MNESSDIKPDRLTIDDCIFWISEVSLLGAKSRFQARINPFFPTLRSGHRLSLSTAFTSKAISLQSLSRRRRPYFFKTR
jgi:hypothetical protein